MSDGLGGYRTPAQVCPRGHGHTLARRDLITRSRLSGRAEVTAGFTFETENCATCGAGMHRECERCGNTILAPVKDRCEFCGLPHPWAAERRAGVIRSRPREWKPLEASHDADLESSERARPIYLTPSGGLYVIEGDITEFAIEGIVSNGDVIGRMWTDVASAIKQVAGEDVERQSLAKGPFVQGAAWSTEAGTLGPPRRKIIHVATMNRRGATDLEITRRCVGAALAEADRVGLSSVAFPAFGTGPSAIAMTAWLDIFGAAAKAYLDGRPHDGGSLDVLLVLYERDDFEDLVGLLTPKGPSA